MRRSRRLAASLRRQHPSDGVRKKHTRSPHIPPLPRGARARLVTLRTLKAGNVAKPFLATVGKVAHRPAATAAVRLLRSPTSAEEKVGPLAAFTFRVAAPSPPPASQQHRASSDAFARSHGMLGQRLSGPGMKLARCVGRDRPARLNRQLAKPRKRRTGPRPCAAVTDERASLHALRRARRFAESAVATVPAAADRP